MGRVIVSGVLYKRGIFVVPLTLIITLPFLVEVVIVLHAANIILFILAFLDCFTFFDFVQSLLSRVFLKDHGLSFRESGKTRRLNKATLFRCDSKIFESDGIAGFKNMVTGVIRQECGKSALISREGSDTVIEYIGKLQVSNWNARERVRNTSVPERFVVCDVLCDLPHMNNLQEQRTRAAHGVLGSASATKVGMVNTIEHNAKGDVEMIAGENERGHREMK